MIYKFIKQPITILVYFLTEIAYDDDSIIHAPTTCGFDLHSYLNSYYMPISPAAHPRYLGLRGSTTKGKRTIDPKKRSVWPIRRKPQATHRHLRTQNEEG